MTEIASTTAVAPEAPPPAAAPVAVPPTTAPVTPAPPVVTQPPVVPAAPVVPPVAVAPTAAPVILPMSPKEITDHLAVSIEQFAGKKDEFSLDILKTYEHEKQRLAITPGYDNNGQPAATQPPAVDPATNGQAAQPATPATVPATTPAEAPAAVPTPAIDPNSPASKWTNPEQAAKNATEDQQWMDAGKLQNEIMRVTGAKDVGTALNTVSTFRTNAQTNVQAAKDVVSIKDSIANLPLPIRMAIQASNNGQNFVQAFNEAGGSMDFTRPVNTYTTEEIVSVYAQKPYQELQRRLNDPNEEFSQADFDSRVNELFVPASQTYTLNQNQYNSKVDEIKRNATQFNTDYATSVTTSMDTLKTQYPSFANPENASEMTAVLDSLSDSNALLKVFYENDGTPKPGAAKMLYLAHFGERDIKEALEHARIDERTNVHIEQVLTPATQTALKDEAQQLVSTQDQKVIQDMSGYNPKPSPYQHVNNANR